MRAPLLLLVVMLVTLGAGVALRPTLEGALLALAPPPEEPAEDFSEYDDLFHDHDHEGVVPLTDEAVENLALRLETLEPSDFTQTLRIPGEVVELPGVSEAQVAAPVAGVVTEVIALPGVSVEPGDPLFRMRVIDERLLEAQLEWLETLTRLETLDAELERLSPYAESGAIAGRKRLELQYERRELAARSDLAEQELLVRGLPADRVESVRSERRLVDSVVVRLPATRGVMADNAQPAGPGPDRVVPVAFDEQPAPGPEGADLAPGAQEALEMTVETLFVNPGQSVQRGEPLCDLAHHRTLFVVGHAFESDIAPLAAAAERGDTLAAEFGEESPGGRVAVRRGLPIRFIAGHVDPETQTYQVFATLPNESLGDRRDPLGRRYRTWRHKVGQRTHLLVPTETLTGRFVLPSEAVVTEGPNAYVFREHTNSCAHLHEEEEEEAGGHDHEDHEEPALELEATPVVIALRSAGHVVLAPGGELCVGDRVAMNSAYQLFLAWKAQSESGGGHHHHDH